ncbi:MAG: hypothetical protein MUE40_08200 [Anaerolineae bacterium]|nr:hypothetical protein [Anaerolineae bacterium]
MSEKYITIALPETTLAHIAQTAQANRRTLEEEIVALLAGLTLDITSPETARRQLQQVSQYPEAALWSLVERHIAPEQEARYYQLSAAPDTLSPAEQAEYTLLLQRLTILMLWRSAALAELSRRGHDTGAYFGQTDR